MKIERDMKLAGSRQSMAGSLIGDLKQTQDVLDFCAEKGIAPDVENGEVRFRYVIDITTLKAA